MNFRSKRGDSGPGEELKEYIEAFRTSSDRARYSLYVVIVASVLIGIANYNLQDWSWPQRRLQHWYAYSVEPVSGTSQTGTPQGSSEIPSDLFHGDPEQLAIAREEYLRQMVSRAFLTSSPLPGVWIDFNDIGLIGGISISLLMATLFLSVLREHENLFLALFKVRSLCDHDEGHADGGSKANFLYHGLAMRQMLSSPPTLARWNKGSLQTTFGLVFLFPALVYSWIVATNWMTMERGARYGVDVDPLLIAQVVLALFIMSLSAACLCYSRSMAKRWESAFFRVNPGRRHVPQMRLREWVKLWRSGADRTTVKLIAQLIDTAGLAGPCSCHREGEVGITAVLCRQGRRLSCNDRDEMASIVRQEGEVAAKAASDHFVALGAFTPIFNEVSCTKDGVRWRVEGTWRYVFQPEGEAAAAGEQDSRAEEQALSADDRSTLGE